MISAQISKGVRINAETKRATHPSWCAPNLNSVGTIDHVAFSIAYTVFIRLLQLAYSIRE